MSERAVLNTVTVVVALGAAAVVWSIAHNGLLTVGVGVVGATAIGMIRALVGRRRLRTELDPVAGAAAAQAALLTSQPRPAIVIDPVGPAVSSLTLDVDPLEEEQRRTGRL
ncbi:MAG: hypothetical protein ACTJHU_06950 [Mycetocola sp.]